MCFIHRLGVAFLVFHAFAVNEELDDDALVALGQYVVPAGNIKIGQGINGEHPAKLVEFSGISALLVRRRRAVQ